MRALSALLATVLLCAAAPLPLRAEQQRAILAASVNGVDFGVVNAIVDGDDVLLRYDQLAALGLSGAVPAGRSSSMVSLKSLAPKVAFSIDMRSVRLAITADPRVLEGSRTVLGVHSAIQAPQASGAYVNYSVQRFGPDTYLSAEGSRPLGRGALYASIVNGNDGRITTNWTADSPSNMRRFVVGDDLESYGDLLGAGIVRGVTVERNFLLDPSYQRVVAGDLSGYVATPTTADVYVNGVLVSRENLPPGPFDIAGLRAASGAANAEIVLHDAYGNQQTLSSNFYESTQVLPKGMNDYAWSAGHTIENGGQSRAGLFGRYDLGVSDSITAGTRLAFARDLTDVGARIAFRSPIGELAVSGIASAAAGKNGIAGSAAYNYVNARYAFTGSLQLQSASFANINFGPQDDKQLVTGTFDFSAPVGATHILGASYQVGNDRDSGMTAGWLLHDDIRLNRGSALSLGVRLNRNGMQNARSFYTTLVFPSGRPGDSASATVQSGGESVVFTRGANQTQPLGYMLALSRDGTQSAASYGGTYAAPFGRYEFSGGSGLGSMSLGASGGIAFIGGGTYFTQPIEESFALVDTAGLAGVAVGGNGAVPLVTGKRGTALLLNLPAYYANTITIDPSKTPSDYTFSSTQQTVVPGYRSGAIVRFPVHRIQSFLGQLVIAGKARQFPPAYGLLTVTLPDGSKATSDIGENGEFYLQNVSPGTYAALIQYRGGTCSFKLAIPAIEKPYVKLGKVLCAQ
jgi:outer membrane usher protein